MRISPKRVREIEAIRDADIDYSEIPEADESFWRRAELQMPQPKKGIYVHLDADVIDWLKSRGKGYQTRMNAMLTVRGESRASTETVPAPAGQGAMREHTESM